MVNVEKRVQAELKKYKIKEVEDSPIGAFILIKHILFEYKWRNEVVKEICNMMIKKLLEA